MSNKEEAQLIVAKSLFHLSSQFKNRVNHQAFQLPHIMWEDPVLLQHIRLSQLCPPTPNVDKVKHNSLIQYSMVKLLKVTSIEAHGPPYKSRELSEKCNWKVPLVCSHLKKNRISLIRRSCSCNIINKGDGWAKEVNKMF